MKYTELLEAKQPEVLECLPLQYKMDALSPVMSEHNVKVHYEILTKNYFKKYEATGDLFQKAGAVLHNQAWACMKPYNSRNKPSKTAMNFIEKHFKSWDKFTDAWLEAATSIHGSGWVMLQPTGKIIMVPNHSIKPNILLVDLWEHQTVDFDYDKEAFLKAWWKVVNWDVFDQKINAITPPGT
jgi:superoxide dismutase, Fe-Mn family